MSRKKKTLAFLLLFTCYTVYSGWVYTYGTEEKNIIKFSSQQYLGKQLWQKNNCSACHQLYGLGGYLGPDLTNIISDPKRGRLYTSTFLRSGGATMPNFHFTAKDIDAITAYLSYVDASVANNKSQQR
jgi:nitric oxide reductase subunit C